MELSHITSAIDHTQLSTTARWEDIRALCDEAIAYGAASVCIPPCYVKPAADYCAGRMTICTVVGFPNGYATTASKVFETRDALDSGADEIDMVINLGWVKDSRWDDLQGEISALKKACGDHILKVIVETCQLTEPEKVKLCDLVTQAGADYIKTSTGFSTAGATLQDVELFAQHIGPGVSIKAAGGVRTLDDAQQFLIKGARRLGTSAIIKQLIQSQAKG